ncbi:MAG: ABC transporter transmembrane domain-containing protein, partial [Novosphingobium sp.]
MESDSETVTTAEPRPARNLGPLNMVWKAALAYPGRVAAAGAALVTTGLSTLAIPWGFSKIIDQGFSRGADPAAIEHWFLVLVGVIAVLATGTGLRFYMVSWLGERVVADLRLAVQANLLRLPPSFFETNSPKEISSRMTADTALIEQVVGTTVSVALRNIIMAVGGTAYLFALAPKLTMVLIAGIVVVVAPAVWFGRRLRTVSRSSQDRVADIGTLATEVLSAMKVVQAFNQEAREAERFRGAVDRTFDTARRRIRIRAVMTTTVMFMIFAALALLMRQGALGVAAGTISGGTIAAFVLTGGLVAGSFGALSEVYGDLVRGAGAASRLNELLHERPAITAPERPQALPSPPRGKLSFER